MRGQLVYRLGLVPWPLGRLSADEQALSISAPGLLFARSLSVRRAEVEMIESTPWRIGLVRNRFGAEGKAGRLATC